MKRQHPQISTNSEISVVDAAYVDGFRIQVVFSDGTRRIVDLDTFLSNAPNPLYKKYRRKSEFKKFEIINGNLNWNDYEMIFPVWDLYSGMIS